VENGVQSAIATAVQAVSNEASRRSLKRCDARISSQFGLSRKATAGAENAGESPSDERPDTADLRQGRESGLLSTELDLGRQFLDLLGREEEAAGQPANRCRPLLLQRVAGPRLPAGYEVQSGTRPQTRHVLAIFRIQLHEESVELVSQTNTFAQHCLALTSEQIEHRCCVIRRDARK
jgi:hypothetical protein